MSDTETPPAATPQFKAAQRWNVVWVVPILALLIGGWLVYRSITSKGPEIRISFETADGIVSGKTEVRCRSVRVGYVTDVELSKDLKSVSIAVRMDPEASHLLQQGTNFWVVRPRVSATDISGLGTLLTGAYIELDPGPRGGDDKVRDFVGKERPPATSLSVPGRRLKLKAEEAGSLVQGSPIYYRGFEVGRIESRELAKDGKSLEYDAFIRQDWGWLITQNTRFWNTSGIDVTADADGVKLRTPSFQAMVSGGVEFGVPEGIENGEPVADGSTFDLFKSYDAAVNSTFAPVVQFLLLFDQSVRGLAKGAPVEFRGIQIGRVAGISLDYNPVREDRRIPVLIEIDPALLRAETRERLKDPEFQFMANAVGRGMRASLKTGSLLTGAKFVDLDYHTDPAYAEISMTGEYKTLPTVSSGFDQLEVKVNAFLDKVAALPLDETIAKINALADESTKTAADASATLKEIETTAASLRKTLDDPAFRELPADLKQTLASLEKSISSVGPDGAIQGDLLRTLDELRATLRSLTSTSTTIGEKPSSLLWGKDSSGNPKPKAPRGR
ncbi:MAG: intermembrane transport protein PqiB [Akkermansiaceae bacterium]|nr:intermembrane transport protein PqiB [Akkermansiaceae bacterium]